MGEALNPELGLHTNANYWKNNNPGQVFTGSSLKAYVGGRAEESKEYVLLNPVI